MKLLKQLGVAAIAVTLMIGCGGAPAPVIDKPKELPAWFTNPKQNDATNLYAVGGGKSAQEAKAKALAAMIEKLSVSVQSSFEKQTIVTRHGRSSSSDETLKSDIKTEVGKIGISNYETVKMEKLGYKNFVAMVKASKSKLVATLKKSLRGKMDALDAKVNSIADQDVLKQLFSYTEAYEKAQGMTTEIMVAGELDKGFPTSKHLKYINSIYKKYLKAKNSVKFHISSSYDARPFADKIKNALAQDYTVVNSGGAIKIVCSVNMNTERSPIGYIATINVKIDVLSKGRKIGGNVVLIKAKAKSNRQASLNRGALSFGKELKEKGIIKILGIRL
jgi:hypothetical protein